MEQKSELKGPLITMYERAREIYHQRELHVLLTKDAYLLAGLTLKRYGTEALSHCRKLVERAAELELSGEQIAHLDQVVAVLELVNGVKRSGC